MQSCTSSRGGGTTKFFRLILGYENLMNYYKTNFSLLHHHKYSLAEFDDMIPWERQIYIKMLTEHIREQNEKVKLIQMQKKNSRRR